MTTIQQTTSTTAFMVLQYTDNGEECKNKCEMSGESYNWCYKVSGSWDYCTPGKRKNII